MDNAGAEIFFGHLKEEPFRHDTFDSTERISAAQEGLSPTEYQAQALAA